MTEPGNPSRRQFLGTSAAAAGISVVAGSLAGCAGSASPTASARKLKLRPQWSIVSENKLPGTKGWGITHLGAPDAIMGYANRASVLAGTPVDLYVSTTSREFAVKAFRIGWYGGDLAREVWHSGAIRGHRQSASTLDHATNTVGTDWGASLTVQTHDWPEGSYLFRLDAHSGAQRYVPLTIRSGKTDGKVVMKNAASTWQAYNQWGGYDLYLGADGSYDDRALVVSLDRPYDKEGATLFMVYERKLINLAERMGLPLAYLSSIDVATEPHVLDGAIAFISPGHDEYWTPEERAYVTAARDKGTNLAFLGANCMYRRIRLQPSRLGPNREVVCYKTSYMEDPLYGKDNRLVTNNFRDPPDPDPESSVIGTLYEGYPTVADFVVATPDAWVYKGTGVHKGTSFRSLVGIEYDRVNPMYPVERPIQILAHSPVTCLGVNSYHDMAYYTHRSGAGVFNVGTMRWVEAFAPPLYGWGLTKEAEHFTKTVTRNVLHAFAGGPAAHKYPAHDNLDAMHEWAGDPLTAGHNLWPPIIL
jgi:hypothetical protein